MGAVADILSWVCLIAGSLFAMTGGLGLLRLPDFYSRMHGSGITDTLGAWLVLLGLILQAGFGLVAVKLVMIGLLLALTSPTSTHALAKAALTYGLEPWRRDKGAGAAGDGTGAGEAGGEGGDAPSNT